MTTDSTEVTQYTPGGVAVHEDGTDFGEVWNSDEYGPGLQEEAKQQEGDALSLEDKQLMSDRHEPFTINECYAKDTANGLTWVIKAVNMAGQEVTLFLGSHEQRDTALEAVQALLVQTRKPVKNVMLHTAFWSQGKPFHVLRPWDGVVQSGLGADARPAPRTIEDRPGSPAVPPADQSVVHETEAPPTDEYYPF